MGDLESINQSNTEVIGDRRKSKVIGTIALLLGLFAPFVLFVFNYESETYIQIISLIWEFSPIPSVFPYSPSFYRFKIHPLNMIPAILPYVLLRLLPASEIYRYYQGKSTRRLAFYASILGDSFTLLFALAMLIIGYGHSVSDISYIPIPCQFLFCVMMLWLFPISKPTTP